MKKIGTYLILLLLFISSCVSTRNLTYLNDLSTTRTFTEEIINQTEIIIQPGDQLGIMVSTLNPESNLLFNAGVLPSTGSLAASAAPTAGRTAANEGYLVDMNGDINFPVLGRVRLGGLTREQATLRLTAELKKNVKNPIVNIRFLNFRITVLGEVARPSTFIVPSERVTLLEALALAGDMTAYGKREDVMIIREKDNVRTVTRANLSDKQFLNSPDFYLQQNDVVYVSPAKIKALQTSTGTYYLSLVAVGASILSLLVVILR